MHGYLIVRKAGHNWVDARDASPHSYRGVYRLPRYPPTDAAELPGLGAYVFSEIKDDDTGLIPTIAATRALLKLLPLHDRRWEVVSCSTVGDEALGDVHDGFMRLPLGWDVAVVRADYWSIVDDFCPARWAFSFLDRLNEHGLFRDHVSAEEYLRQYRAHGEADADCPFDVLALTSIDVPELQ